MPPARVDGDVRRVPARVRLAVVYHCNEINNHDTMQQRGGHSRLSFRVMGGNATIFLLRHGIWKPNIKYCGIMVNSAFESCPDLISRQTGRGYYANSHRNSRTGVILALINRQIESWPRFTSVAGLTLTRLTVNSRPAGHARARASANRPQRRWPSWIVLALIEGVIRVVRAHAVVHVRSLTYRYTADSSRDTFDTARYNYSSTSRRRRYIQCPCTCRTSTGWIDIA
ncbi:unnamed protein product [Sphagnum balticum]